MKNNKKRYIKRAIKERIKEQDKLMTVIRCNRATAMKNVDFSNEEQRKRMAQDFYRGSC